MVKKQKDASKIIQENEIENPKKKQKKMEKVKKAVKAGLIETPEPVLAEFDVNKKSKTNKKVLKEPIVESDEEAEVESDEVEAQTESDEEETQNQSDDEAPEEMEIEREEEEEVTGEAQGYTIYVGNLSPQTKQEQIIKLFNKYEKVLFAIINYPKRARTNVPNPASKATNAFVVFDSVEAASKAIEVSGSLLNGRKVIVSKCRPPFKGDSATTICVKNFSTRNEKKIREFFSSCGSVKSVTFVKVSTFVCFNDPKSVESALKLNGSMLDNDKLKVEKYEPHVKLFVTDKKELDNLSPEELKEKMVTLGNKYASLLKKNPSGPFKPKFKGLPGKPKGPKSFMRPKKFVKEEN